MKTVVIQQDLIQIMISTRHDIEISFKPLLSFHHHTVKTHSCTLIINVKTACAAKLIYVKCDTDPKVVWSKCSLKTFIQQECIKLIKSDSTDIYNVTKYYISNKCCSFELSINL